MNRNETGEMIDSYDELLSPDRNLQRESDDGSKVLFSAISKMVTKLFHSLARKYKIPYTYVGLATTNSAVNTNVDVNINLEGVNRTFKNKSGESIAISDKCYVFCPDGNLNSAFVLVKY